MYKLLSIPFIIIGDLLKLFLVYMPGRTGVRVRRAYYKNKFKHCGENLIVDVGVCIDGLELISIGDNVFIDKYCVIATGVNLIGNIQRKSCEDYCFAEGQIVIGNDVHIAQFGILIGYGGIEIGSNVVLSAGNKIYSMTNMAYDIHDKSKVVSIMPYKQANFLLSPVKLNSNTWLGLNVIAMPGVQVGKNSFCTSNSLLIGKYGENSYIHGQPAKKIRNRFHENIK